MMRTAMTIPMQELLQAALRGFEGDLARIDASIVDVRSQLGESVPVKRAGRGRISKRGRAAISAAQKRRWAAVKAEAATVAKKQARRSKAAVA